MNLRRAGGVNAAVFVAMTVLLAGCGSAGAGSVTSGGEPTPGGTLKLLGSGDVDHLDTASAYYTTSYTLERAYSRQLFSYPATTDLQQAIEPVPDLATTCRPSRTAGSARTARPTPSTCDRARNGTPPRHAR
jgi:ABC-type transport system substrate-binding protein